MDKKDETVKALRAAYPSLTSRQHERIADALIAREDERYGERGLWSWCEDAAERAEQIGYRIDNMRRETPELFQKPPSAEQVFAGKLAALEKEVGDDLADPRNPKSNPEVKRSLWREVQAMSTDDRLEAAKGLTLPSAATPDAEEAAPRFSSPSDPAFENHVARYFNIQPWQLGARKRQELFTAITRANPQPAADKATLNAAEAKTATRALSPGEQREAFRARQRLARNG